MRMKKNGRVRKIGITRLKRDKIASLIIGAREYKMVFAGVVNLNKNEEARFICQESELSIRNKWLPVREQRVGRTVYRGVNLYDERAISYAEIYSSNNNSKLVEDLGLMRGAGL
ncbi:hypothetical protein HYV50_06015 [Candidatus Pacearchaeota archaeon]|nr:hypothetical protein [Candidatus Pacearchaeota archaeon]